MSDIYRAVEILCHNGGCLDAREMVEVGSKLAEMGNSPKERFDAGYRYYEDAEKLITQEEREALFLSVLKSKLGVNKANGDGSGLSLIEGAAAEVMRCFEERERHGWAYQSFDYRDGTERFVDFTALRPERGTYPRQSGTREDAGKTCRANRLGRPFRAVGEGMDEERQGACLRRRRAGGRRAEERNPVY